MASVARRTGRTRHVVRRIVRLPPVGALRIKIRQPLFVSDVPLDRRGEVVVADLREIPLLPQTAVDKRHLSCAERCHRTRPEIRNDRVRMVVRIAHDVCHRRLPPARIDVCMALLTRGRSDVAGRRRMGDGHTVIVVDASQRSNEHHEGPRVDGMRRVRRFPCRHAGQRNAVVDDVVQFAVGQRLRRVASEVRRFRLEVETHSSHAVAVSSVTHRAVADEQVAAPLDSVR